MWEEDLTNEKKKMYFCVFFIWIADRGGIWRGEDAGRRWTGNRKDSQEARFKREKMP
jgi:hypothetical protein